MAEASALIGLVATAAHLSRVIVEIGTKYKTARAQIESFGRELGILSKILDQLRRLLSKDASSLDMSFHVLATEIIDECSQMFSQLNTFEKKLHSNSSAQNISWRGKTKWVFDSAELDYLRARVDSMKINLLLMMTFQTISGQPGPFQVPKFEEQSRSIQVLTLQSNACVQRLQRLEEDMAIRDDADDYEKSSEISIKTFETADSVRSFRDSIISLYDGTPYERDTWSTSQTSFLTAHESQNTHIIVSEIVETYLSEAPMISHETRDIQEESVDSLTAISKSISEGSLQSVLHLDGGGVRTYSTLLILRHLMSEIALAEYNLAEQASDSALQRPEAAGDWIPKAYKSETVQNHHPCYYFDYIAGASTGGLAAIMLGRLRMSIGNCLREFLELLGSMFVTPRTALITNPLYKRQAKYDHHAFEEKFKMLVQIHDSKFQERFVDGSFGSDPFQVKTIAVAWVGLGHRIPYLFRSYDQNEAEAYNHKSLISTTSVPTWQVARALFATPAYFPPFEIGSREFSGSPKELYNGLLPVFQEVTRQDHKSEPSNNTFTLFISIGSGRFRRPNMEIKGLSSAKMAAFEEQMISNITNARGKDYIYHRLNPVDHVHSIKYDEWKKIKGVEGNATIDRITHETSTYLADPLVQENLREIAMSLVQKRRARSAKRNMERYNSISDIRPFSNPD